MACSRPQEPEFGWVSLGLTFSLELRQPATLSPIPQPVLKWELCYHQTAQPQHRAASADSSTPARLVVILVRLKAAPVTKISDTSTSPISSARCCGCTQGFAKVRSKTQPAPTWLWCRVCIVPALPVQPPTTFTQGLIIGKLTLWQAEVKRAPLFSCPFYLERDHCINWAINTFWKFNPKTESSFVFSLQSQISPEQGGSLRAINKGQINAFLLCYS